MKNFPKAAILPIAHHRTRYMLSFPGSAVGKEDFEETMRQIFNEFLNYPVEEVFEKVGSTIPDVHRMREVCFQNDPHRVKQLTQVTAAITAELILELKRHDLIDVNGTVPYSPLNFFYDTVILGYLAD
jgi:hypothetical protein